ncbi:MAG: hypothetical protein ACK4IK_05660 [Bacteroidia bacterium]
MIIKILYIDPGTGSLILQMLIGGIVASALFFKRGWRKIISFFNKENNPEK